MGRRRRRMQVRFSFWQTRRNRPNSRVLRRINDEPGARLRSFAVCRLSVPSYCSQNTVIR